MKEFLTSFWSKQGIDLKADILFSDFSDQERDTIIDDFKMKKTNVLISTNILARGLYFPTVDIVINYDFPVISYSGYREPDYNSYLHRVNRAGASAKQIGISLTFYLEDGGIEALYMNKIQDYCQNEIKEVLNFDQFKQITTQI